MGHIFQNFVKIYSFWGLHLAPKPMGCSFAYRLHAHFQLSRWNMLPMWDVYLQNHPLSNRNASACLAGILSAQFVHIYCQSILVVMGVCSVYCRCVATVTV